MEEKFKDRPKETKNIIFKIWLNISRVETRDVCTTL